MCYLYKRLTTDFSDDVIFITSDGVSDNFDPVVGKFCVIKRPSEPVSLPDKCDLIGMYIFYFLY